MDELPAATSRAKRKAAIAFAIAVASAIFSALELHGWHIYVGLGLTVIAAIYGLTRWKRKYPQPSASFDSRVARC